MVIGLVLLALVAHAQAAEHRVIVEPLVNSTGDDRLGPLSKGFSDLLVAYLSAYDGVKILYREDLYRVWPELARSRSGLDGADTLRPGALMQASTLVKGGFVKVDGTFRADVHVYDIETAALQFSLEDDGTIEHVDTLASSMARSIATKLLNGGGALQSTSIDAQPLIDTHFMKGLGYYYNGLFDHAVAQFMQVIGLDPARADARLWLGKSYAAGGESAHARIEYQRFLRDHPEHEDANKAATALSTLEQGRQ